MQHSTIQGASKSDFQFSVIIVNYNGGSLVRHCVDSVFKYSRNFELIFVDNQSTDNSDLDVARRFPAVLTLKNKDNLGFARANNIGIRRAKGQWIVLLNPDTVVTPGWLDALTKCAQSSPEIGIATPKLLRPDRRTLDSTGHLFNFRTGFSVDRGSDEPDEGQYDSVQEVPSCCFACALIKRQLIEDIGLLDEKMVLYFEDIDYCLRARIAGWKVLYCPSSVVYHARGGLTCKRSSTLAKNTIAYRLRIMLKCYSLTNVLRYGTERILRDILAMVAGIKNNDLRYFLSYLRSPMWNLLNLPIQERHMAQSRRRTLDKEIATLSDRVPQFSRRPRVSSYS